MSIIWSQSLGSLNANNGGYSFRCVISSANQGGGTFVGGNQIRVTFVAAATVTNFDVNNASVGVVGGATAPSTTATPTELKFNGASGFNIGPGTTITSDWLGLQWLATDSLMIIFDFNASLGTSTQQSGTTGTTATYYKPATASYNVATVSGYTTQTYYSGFNSVEGQTITARSLQMFDSSDVCVRQFHNIAMRSGLPEIRGLLTGWRRRLILPRAPKLIYI